MGQKDFQLKGEVRHEDGTEDVHEVELKRRNIQNRVQELGQKGVNRLTEEAEQLKHGQLQNAPIISTSAVIFLGLLLLIPLALYLRPNQEPTFREEPRAWFMNKYRTYDDLWADTKENLADKVRYTQDYLNSIDTDHYRKMAKGKAKDAQKHMHQWRKDLNEFSERLPSTTDVGDTLTQWKNKLAQMKNEGFEYMIDEYRHLTGQQPRHGFAWLFYEVKHISSILLAVAIFGIVLLIVAHLLTNYYFVKNPPSNQRREREVRTERKYE